MTGHVEEIKKEVVVERIIRLKMTEQEMKDLVDAVRASAFSWNRTESGFEQEYETRKRLWNNLMSILHPELGAFVDQDPISGGSENP